MSQTFSSRLADRALWRTQMLVDGAWRDAADGARFAVDDPADGAVLAEVANAGEADAQAAIDAAQRALSAWRALPGKARGAILRAWYEAIQAARADLAALMTQEQGKPLAEANGEIQFGAMFIEWFAEEARRVAGDVPASPRADKRLQIWREPVGVCAAITPWNLPMAMIARKVAPALAAGCTVVLKPAEQTPLTALALGELARRAGVPPGVFNIVTADGARSVEVGKVLCASPVVRKLSFTGSTEVGRLLMAQSAPTVKKLSLELGGLAPFIVFADADIGAAVEGAVAAKYMNAGQTCICPNRFYVHDSVYDAFVAQLAARTAGIRVGRGTEPDVAQGPLIDAAALEKVRGHVEDARARGARVLVGGDVHALGGRFFSPTVLAEVTSEMRCMREEIFGPVAPVMRFHDEAEVIALANDTPFGLAAYFYSRDLARVYRMAEALEFGMVGVNTSQITNEVGPFGGVKQSGLGREGSIYGMDEFLELKYVCIGGLD